jgi:hypothetical protein
MGNCMNCGAPRGAATNCRFCNALYPTSSSSELARLDESTAWLNASPDEDSEMLSLVAMEIDDALDAGRDAAAIEAHRNLVHCDVATSTRVIQARAAYRRG